MGFGLVASGLAQTYSTKYDSLVASQELFGSDVLGHDYCKMPDFVARDFPNEKVDDFHSNRGFQYEKSRAEGLSFWQRFLLWLATKLAPLVGGEGNLVYVRNVVFILAVAFAVYKILRANVQGVFYAGKKNNSPLRVEQELPDANLDYDGLIENYSLAGDYQMAIRFMFLKLLKLISEAGLLELHENKTNRYYRNLLKGSAIEQDFDRLSKVYEYVWFGGVVPSATRFKGTQQEFFTTYSQLSEI